MSSLYRILKYLVDKSLFPPIIAPIILYIFNGVIEKCCAFFRFNLKVTQTVILATLSLLIQLVAEKILEIYDKSLFNVTIKVSNDPHNFYLSNSLNLKLEEKLALYIEVHVKGYKKCLKNNDRIKIFFPHPTDVDLDTTASNISNQNFCKTDGNSSLELDIISLFSTQQSYINEKPVIKVWLQCTSENMSQSFLSLELTSKSNKKNNKIKVKDNCSIISITK